MSNLAWVTAAIGVVGTILGTILGHVLSSHRTKQQDTLERRRRGEDLRRQDELAARSRCAPLYELVMKCTNDIDRAIESYKFGLQLWTGMADNTKYQGLVLSAYKRVEELVTPLDRAIADSWYIASAKVVDLGRAARGALVHIVGSPPDTVDRSICKLEDPGEVDSQELAAGLGGTPFADWRTVRVELTPEEYADGIIKSYEGTQKRLFALRDEMRRELGHHDSPSR